MQSPQAATVPIFWVLMRFWLPIRPGGFPYAGAVPMPDAFPHTFWQIPTGRLSPHTFSADPPYNPQAPKNPTPNPERPATGPANPQPIMHNRFPEPALPASTNQAPIRAAKSYGPARGGGWRRHLLYVCAHLHVHARACTAMGIFARACVRLHGHARTFTAMVTSLHFDPWARFRRDQRGRLERIYTPIQPAQILTSNPWGACTASLRDATTLRRRRRRQEEPEPACHGSA